MSESFSYLNELMKEYSLAIAEYTGNGILITSDDRHTQCTFEAVQLANGTIFLVCWDLPPKFFTLDVLAVSFKGTTSNGYHFSTAKLNIKVEVRPRLMDGITRIVFHLNEFKVSRPNSAASIEIRYGLTNFEVLCDQMEMTATGRHCVLTLTLETPRGQSSLKVSRLPNYKLISRRLSRLKGIEVTSEAIFQIGETFDLSNSHEIIDHLCYILSVAAGTKIQWVYSTEYDERGEIVQRMHSARVTKPFNSVVLIDATSAQTADIATFIEKVYPAYIRRRESFRLDRGTIDAYLDAKSSGDYLEARGSKLAISLEMLKSILFTQPDVSLSRFIVDEDRFDKLSKKIKTAIKPLLEQEGINSDQRSEFYRNLPALNNTTFKQILENFIRYIGLNISKPEINLFVMCRNKLVHEGAFYCDTATQREAEKCPPRQSPWLEYAFMIGFLDRIFLQLLDYDGPYIDWQSGKPVRKDHFDG